MPTPPLTPQQVSQLIDHLLASKDSATVGLRRILKRKTEESKSFPLKELSLEQFSNAGGAQGALEKGEVDLLRMEKQIHELRRQIEDERVKAQAAVQAAFRKGKDEGNASGRNAGKAEAEKEYNTRLAEVESRFQSMFSGMRMAKEEFLTGARRMLLELSMCIARKIVGIEVSLNPDIVFEVIKKALAYISEREHLVVRVADSDMETVTNKRDFWASVAGRLEGIKIEADPRIEKGGCIIESASGVADARTGVLFDEIRDVIDKTWESLLSAGRISAPSETPPKHDVVRRQQDSADTGGAGPQKL